MITFIKVVLPLNSRNFCGKTRTRYARTYTVITATTRAAGNETHFSSNDLSFYQRNSWYLIHCTEYIFYMSEIVSWNGKKAALLLCKWWLNRYPSLFEIRFKLLRCVICWSRKIHILAQDGFLYRVCLDTMATHKSNMVSDTIRWYDVRHIISHLQ